MYCFLAEYLFLFFLVNCSHVKTWLKKIAPVLISNVLDNCFMIVVVNMIKKNQSPYIICWSALADRQAYK
jgi:hypothetical protein